MEVELVTFSDHHSRWWTDSVHAYESSGVLEFPRNRWHDSYGLIDLSRQSSRTSSFIDTIEFERLSSRQDILHHANGAKKMNEFHTHFTVIHEEP
jgi:hypothetical protein